jgi:excisionase family DNA binding protein
VSSPLLTVQQAAQQLRLHPKTVLRYIREGRLRASRIGKGYRIAQADLDALTGLAAPASLAGSGARATCMVDVTGISAEAANRIAVYLGAATTMASDSTTPPLHVRTVFDPALRTLKVVVIGEPDDVARVLDLFQTLRADRS